MIVITPLDWVKRFQGKADHQIAEQILGTLLGYRKNALSRAQDIDNLTHAIKAIRQEGEAS